MRTWRADADFAVARYNPNGTLDTSFGTGGKVTLSLGKSSFVNAGDIASAVAIQTDGKIMVAGRADKSKGWTFNHDAALVRFNANGTLDNTFGNKGIVTTNLGGNWDEIRQTRFQPDGKIVGLAYTGNAIVLVRFNANGTLDSSFDGDGKLTPPFDIGPSAAGAIELQPDGKILMGGLSSGNFAVTRYNSNGTLDGSFGSGGIITTDLSNKLHEGAPAGERLTALLRQADGRIVAVGSADIQVGVNYIGNPLFRGHVALVRYDSNGTLDASFGNAGTVTTDVYGGVHSAALQSDGRIVVVSSGTLLRYNADGSLDSSFGSSAIFIDDAPDRYEGNSGTTGREFTVRRLGGVVRVSFAGTLEIQPSDGRLLIGGSINNDFALARYDAGPGCSPAATATVEFATADGTATVGSDYTATTGTLTLMVGETQTITVQVVGDTDLEANEDFFVNLRNALGASIIRRQGRALIVNDD